MRKFTKLMTGWNFTGQDGNRVAMTLPHTWNNKDGQDGGNDYYRGKCLYKKLINKLELPNAGKYYLEINGANSS